jgi:hypothetical protein
MRSFFLAVLILVAIVVCVGYYRDWFNVATKDSDNKTDIHLSVDKQKIKEDAKAAEKKVKEEAAAIKEKGKEAAGAARDKAKEKMSTSTAPAGDKPK